MKIGRYVMTRERAEYLLSLAVLLQWEIDTAVVYSGNGSAISAIHDKYRYAANRRVNDALIQMGLVAIDSEKRMMLTRAGLHHALRLSRDGERMVLDTLPVGGYR